MYTIRQETRQFSKTTDGVTTCSKRVWCTLHGIFSVACQKSWLMQHDLAHLPDVHLPAAVLPGSTTGFWSALDLVGRPHRAATFTLQDPQVD